jgi:ribosome-binding protein aMBF1 (putative translation factor)
MKKTKTLTEVISNNLLDNEFKELYDRELLINSIAHMVLNLRKKAGLSQTELAGKVGTTQPVIARLEGGKDTRMPSIDLLSKIASAAKSKLNINFIKL